MFGFKRKNAKISNFYSDVSPTVKLKAPVQTALAVMLDEENVVHLKFGNAQHIGSREQQQDSFGYSNLLYPHEIANKGVLAVLADGMGGLSNGKQASEYVVTAMLSMFDDMRYDSPIPDQLKCMAEKMNEKVCETYADGSNVKVGSTLSAALIYKTKLFWVCVGDSRIYVYRKGALYQLNEDHNYMNQLLTEHVRNGLSLVKAKNDEQKSALTSYIGNSSLSFIDYNKRGFAIQRGDRFVLCSDGVYNALNNAALVECLIKEPQEAASAIKNAVISKEIYGQDNTTIMIIEYK